MKRKTAALALCGLMVFALAGCGGENAADTGAAKTSEDVEYDVNDYVTLGDYQNLEVQITGDYTVDQSDVDAMVAAIEERLGYPVIIKPVTERSLPENLQPALARDALADDLYTLAYPAPGLRVGGGHFRKTPFCLTDD